MQPIKSCLHCQFLCHILKALISIKISLKLSYFCKKCEVFLYWVSLPGPPNISPLRISACALGVFIADMLFCVNRFCGSLVFMVFPASGSFFEQVCPPLIHMIRYHMVSKNDEKSLNQKLTSSYYSQF